MMVWPLKINDSNSQLCRVILIITYCTGLDSAVITPKKNNLLATIPTWGPTYKVSMELKVNSFDGPKFSLNQAEPGSEMAEILRFTTTENDCCGIGDSIPAIFANKRGFIRISSTGLYEHMHHNTHSDICTKKFARICWGNYY